METKVRKLRVSNLQNHEQYGFMVELRQELELADIPELKPFLERMKPLIEEEDSVLEMVSFGEQTKQLAQLDDVCDACYRGLVKSIRIAGLSPEADEREASLLLEMPIRAYGNFVTESYEVQHSKTINLIQELRSERFKPAADLIGATWWIDRLEKADSEFMNLYRIRRNMMAEAAKAYRPMRLIRRELEHVYRETETFINALALLHPREELTTLITRINVHVDRLRATMAGRSTRARNKRENEEEQDNQPDKI